MKKNYTLLITLCALLLSHVSFAQLLYPGGATCEEAIFIPTGEEYYTPLDDDFSDHWYSFIAPCDGLLTVSNDGEHECTKRIYSGVCGSLTLLSEAGWDAAYASAAIPEGESVFIQIDDSWDMEGDFNVVFTGCDDVDSSMLDISGKIYYDNNNNGMRDPGENGKPLNFLMSDPAGLLCTSGVDGFYFGVVDSLDDGTYQFAPILPEHWEISTDSAFYTLNITDSFESRDSLNFGIYPDTFYHEVNAEFIGGFPRCNDTISYALSLQNTGTIMIESGLIHLELDDSLYYVSAAPAPDSIVGQHIYWHYEDLLFGEWHTIFMQVGTPDGVDDAVSSSLTATIDSADVEVFSTITTLDQLITCAYDPNDKTPEPLGVGEFGYISPETESIEYLIRFQNTGTDTAFNVTIKDQLDENLDWYSIDILAHSHDMKMEMDLLGEVSFIFEDIMLPDSNVNFLGSQGFVKYRMDLKPGLPLETSIFNTAHIYFDLNPAVITNTTINTLHLDESGLDELVDNQQMLVYPNPFSETTTVYFGNDLKDHSIQIVDLLGKQVYANNQLSGNKLEIQANDFKAGMYVLVLIDNKSGEVVSNAKLIVE